MLKIGGIWGPLLGLKFLPSFTSWVTLGIVKNHFVSVLFLLKNDDSDYLETQISYFLF